MQYEVYIDMPYDGIYVVTETDTLEEAQKIARKIDNGTFLEYKKSKSEGVGIKVEYDF